MGSANIESVRNASLSNFLLLSEIKFFDKSKDHWVFFSLENETNSPFEFVLTGGRNAQETYYIIIDNEITEKKTGYFVPIQERDIEQNYLNRVNLSIPENSTIDVYVKVENPDDLPLDFDNYKLISKDTWNKSVLQTNLFQGIFSGMMIILILLPLLLCQNKIKDFPQLDTIYLM